MAKAFEKNILEWRFVIEGPPDSPYAGGLYLGKLKFPDQYPMKPPSIMMLTPNGRFETDRRLCLSMSDFHPETWNPGWSVATILKGVLSFMLDNEVTTGGIETTDDTKRTLAASSRAWTTAHKDFQELFAGTSGGMSMASVSKSLATVEVTAPGPAKAAAPAAEAAAAPAEMPRPPPAAGAAPEGQQ